MIKEKRMENLQTIFDKDKLPIALQKLMVKAFNADSKQLIKMIQNPLLRKIVLYEVEKLLLKWLKESRVDPAKLPGIEDDKTTMSLAIMGSIDRALKKDRLSEPTIRALLQILVKVLFIEGGDMAKRNEFKGQYGQISPSFLLISPTKACNLRCTGCYADSTDQRNTLEWSVVDRIITEAKTLWGDRFFVISGGEPFAFRSEGKDLMDLVEKHNDCIFMTYTNSILITEEISHRLSKSGNMLLCISLEGWKESTDSRRGAGVFDKVVANMNMLRKDGVPFGISLTGTRHNAEEILSEDFIDYFIEQGALFAWLFQYMPIGRAFTLDLMVTPQQRAWMWRQSWSIIRSRRFFMADFWNHGTTVDGCLSAGGHGGGGYFHIDWNGAVSPCVFMPYSPVNIHDIYVKGGTITDVWKQPFFASLRKWQKDYQGNKRNGLTPCPNRDHHDELGVLLRQYEPDPTDSNAVQTLIDPDYTKGLVAYNREFEAITDEIWERHYLHRKNGLDGRLADLPEVPDAKNDGLKEEIKETARVESIVNE